MPRIERTDVGEYIYHVLNRANVRVQIFDNDKEIWFGTNFKKSGETKDKKWWLTPIIPFWQRTFSPARQNLPGIKAKLYAGAFLGRWPSCDFPALPGSPPDFWKKDWR